MRSMQWSSCLGYSQTSRRQLLRGGSTIARPFDGPGAHRSSTVSARAQNALIRRANASMIVSADQRAPIAVLRCGAPTKRTLRYPPIGLE